MMHREVEAIVRGFEDGYAAAFGRKDAKALSDLLAGDATLLPEWGDVVQGQVNTLEDDRRRRYREPRRLLEVGARTSRLLSDGSCHSTNQIPRPDYARCCLPRPP